MGDLKKCHVYDCVCGCHPVRPIGTPPKPCDHCFAPLDGQPFEVVDQLTFARDLIDEAHGRPTPRKYFPAD